MARRRFPALPPMDCPLIAAGAKKNPGRNRGPSQTASSYFFAAFFVVFLAAFFVVFFAAPIPHLLLQAILHLCWFVPCFVNPIG